ncbi:hypothetical protein KKF92_01095 [Patescibacteria group bacterium]|nr:hypothetical protein [Patescibacteria group bacterium]
MPNEQGGPTVQRFTAEGRRQPGPDRKGFDIGAVRAGGQEIRGTEIIIDQPVESLKSLNEKYPISNLCGPESLKTIQSGLTGHRWVSLFRESPFHDSGWEMWLGGYVTESMIAGQWGLITEQTDDMQKAVQTGMVTAVETPAGVLFQPTEKLCHFVQERLAQYTV